MEARTVVETDFIELLARLISDGNEENPRERSGSDLKCSQPIFGRWIEDCDFPFLMETLALPDSVFKEEFPGILLTQEDRKIFAQTLEAHCTECARCHAKRTEDIEWKSRVEKAFAENKQLIGAVLSKAAGKP